MSSDGGRANTKILFSVVFNGDKRITTNHVPN